MIVPDHFELVSCPACGEQPFVRVAIPQRRKQPPDQPAMQVVRCGECGLNYLNPRPTADHLLTYYSQDYAPHGNQRGEVKRRWKLVTLARLLVMKNAYGRPDLRPRGAKKIWATMMSWCKSARSCGEAIEYFGNGRLLDFGCGSGTFLRRMREMGWDGTGIDFSEAAVSRVKESGIPAYIGSLPCEALQRRTFDLITMRHVLEHVADPRAVLRAALDLLSPGGELRIQSPNFASWEIEHFGDAANMLDLPRHLIHWDAPTLRRMLQECGYEDVEVRPSCRAGSLRKSARRMDATAASPQDRLMAKSTLYCKWVAQRCERQGRGNELIARATKPVLTRPAPTREGQIADALV